MQRRLLVLSIFGTALLLINSALLAAFPTDSLFEIANVLLHMGLGAAVGVAAVMLARVDRNQIGVALAAASGVLLAAIGNTRDHFIVFLVHVIVSLVAAAVLFARTDTRTAAIWTSVLAALLLVAGFTYRYALPHPRNHIAN